MKADLANRDLTPSNDELAGLRAAVRNLRHRHGLAYRHVAEAIGCSWTDIRDLETAWRDPPLTLVVRVLAALGGELRVYVPSQEVRKRAAIARLER